MDALESQLGLDFRSGDQKTEKVWQVERSKQQGLEVLEATKRGRSDAIREVVSRAKFV